MEQIRIINSMAKKEKISSNFISIKAMAILFFFAALYILFIQDENPIQVAIGGTLIVWGIALTLWFYAMTRNKVYYDKEKFYIHNWKGVEIDVVPNEKITSMLFSGFGTYSLSGAYRLFYDSDDGQKKEFWIFPNLKTNTWTIKEQLKKENPDLLTTKISFGGIEHFFIRNEDGFR